MQSVDRGEIRAAIERHGAVLLRGFATTVEDFGDLGLDLCSAPSYNESPHREVLQGESSVQTVNLGVDPFPLHPELSREPWRPDLAMFACFDPPEVGGQTNICDGIAIAENLPAEVQSQLANGILNTEQSTAAWKRPTATRS
mgnify:CR=1 FL=1